MQITCQLRVNHLPRTLTDSATEGAGSAGSFGLSGADKAADAPVQEPTGEGQRKMAATLNNGKLWVIRVINIIKYKIKECVGKLGCLTRWCADRASRKEREGGRQG